MSRLKLFLDLLLYGTVFTSVPLSLSRVSEITLCPHISCHAFKAVFQKLAGYNKLSFPV